MSYGRWEQHRESEFEKNTFQDFVLHVRVHTTQRSDNLMFIFFESFKKCTYICFQRRDTPGV